MTLTATHYYRGLWLRNDHIVKLLAEGKTAERIINFPGRDGFLTPLLRAVYAGNDAMVKALLGTGKVYLGLRNRMGQTAFPWATERGEKNIVKMLLDRDGIDVNMQDHGHWGRTPLMGAAKDGFEEIVQLLLKKEGIDVNVKGIKGETALSLAEEFGRKGVVRLLRESGKLAVDE
jgi:ankyrin repeat protein